MQQPNFKSGWIFRGAVFTGLAALFGMVVIPAAMGLVSESDIPPLTAQVRAELIDRITDPRELAARLQEALLEKTDNDRHLRLGFSIEAIPEPRAGKEEEPLITWEKITELTGIDAIGKMQAEFGVSDSEVMSGNVGYLRISSFFRPELSGPKYAAAMKKLAGTRALVIDLRDARKGGHPEGVRLLSSYFFDQRTHLNDIYWREAKETTESWTLDTLDGPRYGAKRPLIVLTNRATFSACEEFVYNLQSLKRAIVVGKTTGGGAHPGGRVRLTSHFWAGIPSGRPINPVTRANWEGTGVVPDHVVSSADALKVARNMLANGQAPLAQVR